MSPAVKTVATAEELLAALADSATGTVKLTADIDPGYPLNIAGTVALDLNGHVLQRFYIGDGPVINVESGGALTLIDSDPTVGHKFSDSGRKLWRLSEYGTNIVNGGVITGDPLNLESGVYVQKGGTFIMTGGNIVGCYSSYYGAGVRAEGSFTMTGGNIDNCRASIDGDTPFYFDGPVLDAVSIKAKRVEGVPVPRLRINAENNEWEVSYDAGYTWASLGVKATGEKGEKGDKGDKGDAGTDGKDGINGVNGANGTDGRDGKDGGKKSGSCTGVSLVGALSGVLLSGIGFALIKRRKPF